MKIAPAFAAALVLTAACGSASIATVAKKAPAAKKAAVKTVAKVEKAVAEGFPA